MPLLPFGGLSLALCAFLLSTRQDSLVRRCVIWLVGAALLVFSIWLTLSAPHGAGFLSSLVSRPQALMEAFGGNLPTIAETLPVLLDLLIPCAVIVGVICLVALSPGELIERMIRPVATLLVGVVLGATATLAIVAVGFGDVAKREVYLGVLKADDVHDGDTVMMGDVSLRLWGVDAPELSQPCLADAASLPCGELARQTLVNIAVDKLLLCKKAVGSGVPTESFGRPLVRCFVQSDTPIDIGREMLRVGCADLYRDHGKVKSDYPANIEVAQRHCPPFQQPGDWRGR